jgi:hypothetical protein
MAELGVSPVELGFSEFVSKLVSDTFEAIVSSTLSQEENWIQLRELLAHNLDDFSLLVIDDNTLELELNRVFPINKEGMGIIIGRDYQKADPEQNIQEEPPIYLYTGYQPSASKLAAEDVEEIYRLVRNQLGQRQYDIMSNVLSKGTTKLVVDAGKINAKLNFEILQVEEAEETEEDNTSGNDIQSIASKRIFVKNKLPVFSGLSRPTEMKNVHFFVKPPTDSDPQTHQVKANVYGEVEIQFKTIT